jgi:N-methylhydantoinase B
MTRHIDPILMALTQNRLDHICRHMGWVMSQTALSPIFSQAHDFSCYITGRDGHIISQGGWFARACRRRRFRDPCASRCLW